ncbi:hypothetical protein [Saccharopolyspora griseoalba]|uniref:Uncharacterized protein n=1 Tax=Saccharopolyspora griseoalba TaxID=1431848 RepID=A0ABW2LFU3_9PSEU
MSRGDVGLLVERAVAEVAEPQVEPGVKARSLAVMRAALTAEEELAAAASRRVARAAEEAVWLGASLADLGELTGRSRQAARKRWPGLGAIHRKRKWLGDHVEAVRHVGGLVASRADDLAPVAGNGAFLRLISRLREGLRRCEADFAEGAEESVENWRAFDELVDVTLRAVIETAGTPATPQADFALHCATGVVGHYDHAVSGQA